MKKRILYFVCFFAVLISCKSLDNKTSISESICGSFSYTGRMDFFDFEYQLKLYSDSTFIFEKKYPDANPRCKGKWILESTNKIGLYCSDTESITTILSSSYMHQRYFDLIILNKDEIEIDTIVLRRTQSE